MINDVLVILRDAATDYLHRSVGHSDASSDQGDVVFPESDKLDCIDFKLGAISLILVNVEQEHSLRPADPYRRIMADGTTQRIKPAISLNVYVLFAARFKEYKQSLRYISLILKFFLGRPVLDHENTPGLSDRIEKLTMELVTLPLAEQNNLWGILRTAYQPSLLYKVRMVAFHDEDSLVVPVADELIMRLGS